MENVNNRLKYHPDGWVYINRDYTVKYDVFAAHCFELNLTNPITEGVYFTYTPGEGCEIICKDTGCHEPCDGKDCAEKQAIIDNVNSFKGLLNAA